MIKRYLTITSHMYIMNPQTYKATFKKLPRVIMSSEGPATESEKVALCLGAS